MSHATVETRRAATKTSPIWTGDLADDCSAKWAGFFMRAEVMEEGRWWYSVRDVATGVTVEDSATTSGEVSDGVTARAKCEEAARRFLSVSSDAPKA